MAYVPHCGLELLILVPPQMLPSQVWAATPSVFSFCFEVGWSYITQTVCYLEHPPPSLLKAGIVGILTILGLKFGVLKSGLAMGLCHVHFRDFLFYGLSCVRSLCWSFLMVTRSLPGGRALLLNSGTWVLSPVLLGSPISGLLDKYCMGSGKLALEGSV